MRRGHEEIAKGGREDLVGVTGGSISSRQLRLMGHPYGRGASAKQRGDTKLMRKKAPLLPINKQTGKLRGGVFLRRASGGTQSFDVGSSAKHSAFIFHPAGTKKMVGRGVMSGKQIGFNGPTGFLEKKWRLRNRAFQDVFIRNQRKP